MGLFGRPLLPAPGAKPGQRPQREGGQQVATDKNWQVQADQVATNGHWKAQGTELATNRDWDSRAAGDQGVLSGLPMGSEPTGTPYVERMVNGVPTLCEIQIDPRTGQEVVVPRATGTGRGSEPMAGECIAAVNPETGREEVCRVVMGRDGKKYLISVE
jgi:hypothetical protein